MALALWQQYMAYCHQRVDDFRAIAIASLQAGASRDSSRSNTPIAIR
ncbi:MAG: hypothetical protein AAF773_21170 [Cyanobacteria bacterium P01_D01_bin.115]